MNETSGNTFYVDQDKDFDESAESVDELDLSVNSWIMLADDEEALPSHQARDRKSVV